MPRNTLQDEMNYTFFNKTMCQKFLHSKTSQKHKIEFWFQFDPIISNKIVNYSTNTNFLSDSSDVLKLKMKSVPCFISDLS